MSSHSESEKQSRNGGKAKRREMSLPTRARCLHFHREIPCYRMIWYVALLRAGMLFWSRYLERDANLRYAACLFSSPSPSLTRNILPSILQFCFRKTCFGMAAVAEERGREEENNYHDRKHNSVIGSYSAVLLFHSRGFWEKFSVKAFMRLRSRLVFLFELSCLKTERLIGNSFACRFLSGCVNALNLFVPARNAHDVFTQALPPAPPDHVSI